MGNQYNPQIHHRRSIRLKDYDYDQPGAYFITICSQNRECLFGNIIQNQLQLNQYGQIIEQVWNYLPDQFPHLDIDAAVIMPNHFHGIVIITDTCRDLVSKSLSKSLSRPQSKSDHQLTERPFYEQKTKLGKIIAYFKYQTTKFINQKRNSVGVKVWQSNYYEHIIRNEKTLAILQNYIIENPLRWEIDQLHPNNPSKW